MWPKSSTVVAISSTTYNGDLYVAGSFFNVAGIAAADFVARWNGTKWFALGSNGSGDGAVPSVVSSMTIWLGFIVIGGGFTNVAGISNADYVAVWIPNDSTWFALAGHDLNGALNAGVDSVAASGTALIVGGQFVNAAGIDEADYIAKYENNTWSALGPTSGAPDGEVYTVADDGTNVYAGGDFTNKIAKFNGTSWSAPGGGLNDYVNKIALSGSDVYVGGNFTNAGGDGTADYLAKFDGSSWSGLGSNGSGDGWLTGSVWTLLVSGTTVFAGGDFVNAGGMATADYIAKFDGSSWSTLGGTTNGALNGPVSGLYLNGSDLFVGGYFSQAMGNTNASQLALWHNNSWFPIGGPGRPDGRIRKGSGSFIGNNVYNNTAKNQTKTAPSSAGQTVTFGISLQNDKNVSDRFVLKATGNPSSSFEVKFFKGTTDITAQVMAGTYETPVIAAGAKLLITAKLKVMSRVLPNETCDRLVTITSVNAPTVTDAVKFVVQT